MESLEIYVINRSSRVPSLFQHHYLKNHANRNLNILSEALYEWLGQYMLVTYPVFLQ